MKTYIPTRRSRGFTLVELLVVISIVAVLAAMSFAGVQIAIRKAKTADGKTAAVGLAQAVDQFYSEYNRVPELQKQFDTASGDGRKLLEIMLAEEESSDSMENPRSIRFFSGKEGKGKKGGLYYGGGNKVQAMYDPFGNPYKVVLNTDYDDELKFQVGSRQERIRGANVAIYSAGADMQLGNTDDITSW